MNSDVQRALHLLLPIVRERLNVVVDARDTQEFLDRFSVVFPQLFPRLLDLYGHRWDFFHYLQQLVIVLADSWIAREQDLLELDRIRQNDPQWFQRETMVGAMVYVDLFSGNLSNLEKKVDYFVDLGITYLHLMPLFKAPEKENDGGYAVSSYREINPELGTLADLRALAKTLQKKGISLVLDFIFNHTSDEHDWAIAAKEGRKEFRDYYWIFPEKAEADQYNQTLRDIFPDVRSGSFTYNRDVDGWVWTTFNNFQWDLNYQNPATFIAMVGEMLGIANVGAQVLRLDALAFCWKELGTSCENLPKAHTLIQAFRLASSLVAPAMAFKSEAIVHPDEVAKYIAPHECEISYNPLLMALLWESLATRNTDLLRISMQHRFTVSEGCTWVNYVRSHDDIGWTFADEDARTLGIDGYHHRRFLNNFYTGNFPGSFSRGVPFQYNPETGDCRISGTTASLTGLEKSFHLENPQEAATEKEMGIRRILLIHGIIIAIGGIPLIYIGDEVARMNDYSYSNQPGKSKDSRWVHRPAFDWSKSAQKRAADPGTPSGRIMKGIRDLIELRKSLPTLGVGSTQILDSENNGIFAFVRTGEIRKILVLANMTDKEQRVRSNVIRLQGLYPICKDLLTGNLVNPELPMIDLEPYQQMWLVPENS